MILVVLQHGCEFALDVAVVDDVVVEVESASGRNGHAVLGVDAALRLRWVLFLDLDLDLDLGIESGSSRR